MNSDSSSLEHRLIDQLPGLLGALQPLSQALEAARRNRLNGVLTAPRLTSLEHTSRPQARTVKRTGPARVKPRLSGVREDGAPERKVAVAAGISQKAPGGAAVRGLKSYRQGSAPARRRGEAGPGLRDFRGTLGARLRHPPVLPGGWQLYGYEKETGNPVYAGPGGDLKVYA